MVWAQLSIHLPIEFSRSWSWNCFFLTVAFLHLSSEINQFREATLIKSTWARHARIRSRTDVQNGWTKGNRLKSREEKILDFIERNAEHCKEPCLAFSICVIDATTDNYSNWTRRENREHRSEKRILWRSLELRTRNAAFRNFCCCSKASSQDRTARWNSVLITKAKTNKDLFR